MITSALLSLLLPALVSAHGFLSSVSIDGKVYQGNSVGTTASVQSVIRQINTNSPVKGATNPSLNCGQGAQLAAQVASANPGSSVQVSWSGGVSGSSSWPHNTGPIMHYMAKCQGSCSSYNSSNAEWFKISELGYQSDGKTWYQAELQAGKPVSVTIPNNLAPGDYLLRSEIIALQLAMSPGGAEFYPACIQLSVGGSHTGQPTSSEQVTLPGGYSDNDPGILVPNVYNPGFSYTFPGPPVAAFISGGSTFGSSGGSGSSSVPAASSPSATPSSAPSAPASPGNAGGYPPSSPSAPSSPANAGGNPPAPSPTSTGGSSTCMRKRTVNNNTRMHRRRRPSH